MARPHRSARPKRSTRNNPTTPRATSATVVELITVAKGRHTTLSLRAVRTHRVLFECSTTDLRGTELATLTVERYCIERGLVLVMPANDTARATKAA